MTRFFAILLSGMLICQGLFAQDFSRRRFPYEMMADPRPDSCGAAMVGTLNEALELIQKNRSREAVKLTQALYQDNAMRCLALYEVHSWALFRSGEWLDALVVMDSAIALYGPEYTLVYRRGLMNIEMAELGPGVRHIDGNAVYLSKTKQLPYGESQFKAECYQAALEDFSFVAAHYPPAKEETYYCGYILQQLGRFDEANTYYYQLLVYPELADMITSAIADNFISRKEFKKAEQILLDMEKEHPRYAGIQAKLVEVYEGLGHKAKKELASRKYQFYTAVPYLTGIDFSEASEKDVLLFLSEAKVADKMKRLNDLGKDTSRYASGMLVAVIYMHANHGNGVEERAVELLGGRGSSVVSMVVNLLSQAQSTCTIEMAADVLAMIKDTSGWQPMVDLLPSIQHMPITLTPPDIPGALLRFDKQRALPVLLDYIRREMLFAEKNESDPFGELGSLFTDGLFYGNLEKISRSELEKVATDIGYTTEELSLLMKKVFDK